MSVWVEHRGSAETRLINGKFMSLPTGRSCLHGVESDQIKKEHSDLIIVDGPLPEQRLGLAEFSITLHGPNGIPQKVSVTDFLKSLAGLSEGISPAERRDLEAALDEAAGHARSAAAASIAAEAAAKAATDAKTASEQSAKVATEAQSASEQAANNAQATVDQAAAESNAKADADKVKADADAKAAAKK